MRARAFVPMFLFAVSLPALAGEEKKEDAFKVDMSYLEKTWGIKCKSQRITDDVLPFGGRRDSKTMTFLLEFTKDVENLNELRAAFSPINAPFDTRSISAAPLLFYFLDEDNVFLYKSPPNAIEGEVTGKQGDAIRVSIRMIDNNFLKKTRKMDARAGESARNKKAEKK